MTRPDSPAPPIAPLRTAQGSELTLQKRRRTRVFELRDADRVYATLERRSVFGSLAHVATEAGRFTFKRIGFLRSRATIRREGTEDNYAVLEPRWTGEGRVTLADGRELHWERDGFWRPTWRIDDANGATLFWMRSAGFTGNRGLVTLAPGFARTRDAALLIVFAWYLVQLMSEEAAAAAAS
jgi:hypothetical protein